MKIEPYERHAMYPTRFMRWALGIDTCVLQQLWRNFSGDEEWRPTPSVHVAPVAAETPTQTTAPTDSLEDFPFDPTSL